MNDVLHNGVACNTAFMWEPAPEEEWREDSDSGSDSDREPSGPANPDGFWGIDRRPSTTWALRSASAPRGRHILPSTKTWPRTERHVTSSRR